MNDTLCRCIYNDVDLFTAFYATLVTLVNDVI